MKDIYLGVNIFRPITLEDNEYKIIFKFDRASNLRIWQESECRCQWLARAKSLRLDKPTVRVITGLETWFTLPSRKPMIPPRYTMAIIVLLTIFPISSIICATGGGIAVLFGFPKAGILVSTIPLYLS